MCKAVKKLLFFQIDWNSINKIIHISGLIPLYSLFCNKKTFFRSFNGLAISSSRHVILKVAKIRRRIGYTIYCISMNKKRNTQETHRQTKQFRPIHIKSKWHEIKSTIHDYHYYYYFYQHNITMMLLPIPSSAFIIACHCIFIVVNQAREREKNINKNANSVSAQNVSAKHRAMVLRFVVAARLWSM